MFVDDEREQMPLEAREIHQQLLDDSSRWARELPDDTRVAEFARTLRQRTSFPSTHQTRNVLAHRRPSSTLTDMMSVKGHTSMLKLQGPRRTLAASIAAVAVVALMVGVLYNINTAHGTRAGSGSGSMSTATPAPTLTPDPYGVYGATPGPLAKYVAEIVTAGGRSADGTPTQVKTHFLVGDWVYVVAVVHGLPKGMHVISIAWYMNGLNVDLPATPQTSKTIDGDKRVIFGLQFPTGGLGTAKIFIDRPASDTSESSNDPYLAETVTFVVEMTQPTVAPGTPTPTLAPGNPTPTPTPFAIATPGA